MRRYRSNWEPTGRAYYWWLPERKLPNVFEWSLAAAATPVRRILWASLFLGAAAIAIGSLLSAGEGEGSLRVFVRLAFGPLAAVLMLLVIGQAVRDLVTGENRAPWPFFTHMEGIATRGQVIGIAVYLACVWVVYSLIW
jgi:hypothetical protein